MSVNSAIGPNTRDATQLPVVLAPDTIASPGIEFLRMQQKWELHSDLWNGTERMRQRSVRWLPQEEGESDKAYKARLKRTFLFNGYKSTIQRLAGQVFFRPVNVENVPSELQYLENDFDSEGRSLTEVAHDLLIKMLRYGKAHGIVDYPSGTSNLTLAEERELKVRPYFTEIDPRDLIAWRSRRVGGADILEQIRIQEYVVEPFDEHQEIETYRIRAFYPDEIRVYSLRQNENAEAYTLEDEMTNTLGKIPLVTAYGAKTGFLTAEPPLDDLAWLNLRHWQSTSDQNTILHVTRVPIFFAKGFEDGELENTTIGPYRGISTSSENADIDYIEHSGEAIGAGRQDLRDLEEQMHEIGADLLVSRSVDRQTASARSIDRAESLSMLQTMVMSLERLIKDAYVMAGEWIGVDASDVRVSISEEFRIPVEANPTEDLVNLYEKGIVSYDRFVSELQRRGTLSESKNGLTEPEEINANEPSPWTNEQENEVEETDPE